MPRIETLSDPTAEDRAAILSPLETFSQSIGFVWRPESLVLVLRDDAGMIVGGLIAETNWGWLHISILAVAEHLRGQDWGSGLMNEAERMARDRGCHHAWVDTFSFQARPFYERLGYRVFGELPNYPSGETRYFLSKPLGPPGDEPSPQASAPRQLA